MFASLGRLLKVVSVFASRGRLLDVVIFASFGAVIKKFVNVTWGDY